MYFDEINKTELCDLLPFDRYQVALDSMPGETQIDPFEDISCLSQVSRSTGTDLVSQMVVSLIEWSVVSNTIRCQILVTMIFLQF